MAYLKEYNQITTIAGRLVTTAARIRQYIEHKDNLIINVGAGEKDPEYGKDIGGNVFCYDRYGKLKWQSKSKNVAEIYIENNELHFYDTSSLGYDCLIDVETGEIKKITPVK